MPVVVAHPTIIKAVVVVTETSRLKYKDLLRGCIMTCNRSERTQRV